MIRRLERDARGSLDSFELLDGGRYFFDPLEVHKELFLCGHDLQLGRVERWAEPPEIFRKICEAKDPAAVLERLAPDNPEHAFVDPAALYDREVLVNERRLVPLAVDPPEDLSEP